MSTNIADAVPRLKRLIPRLCGKRIGVLGDLMLDRYLWGTASRLSPEAAVPVVDFVEQSECLGGSGNVAANILHVPVFVKPKTSRLYAYRGARAIVCNAKEAGFYVTRSLADEKSVEEAGRALLAHFGCGAVVITRGEKGMSVFEESWPRHLHVPATSFEVTYARVGQSGLERGASGRQVFDVTR